MHRKQEAVSFPLKQLKAAPRGCVLSGGGCCKQGRGGSYNVVFPWRGQSIGTVGLERENVSVSSSSGSFVC